MYIKSAVLPVILLINYNDNKEEVYNKGGVFVVVQFFLHWGGGGLLGCVKKKIGRYLLFIVVKKK